MKTFKFTTYFGNITTIRNYLTPTQAKLPSSFSLKDIKDDTFSSTIIDKLKKAKNGTQITLLADRRRFHSSIYIKVTNLEERKLKRKNLRTKLRVLNKKLKILLQDKNVTKYININSQVKNLERKLNDRIR